MNRPATAVAILLLSGCGGEPLAEADPAGYQACVALIRSVQSPNAHNRIKSLLAAGRAGRSSSNEDIRAAVKEAAPLSGLALPDADKLREACQAHGVDVPQEQTGHD